MKNICPLCGTENKEDARFCKECNEPLYNIQENAKEISFIRRWDIYKEEEIKRPHTDKITTDKEILFASMIHGLCFFVREDARREKIPEFQNTDTGLDDICKHFGNDASLFEVGCYLFFLLDLWLFHNKPDLRETITKYFTQEFIKLFSAALDMDSNNLIDLYNKRGFMYADIIRNNEDWIKDCHLILRSLVLKTKDNKLPQRYGKYKVIPLELGLIENYLIGNELFFWEEAFLPILLDNLEKYCYLFEEEI